jgi:hypothetical protein
MTSKRTASPKMLTVTRSETLLRLDGRAAIELSTIELGHIPFEVNLQAIAALRRHLSTCGRNLAGLEFWTSTNPIWSDLQASRKKRL